MLDSLKINVNGFFCTLGIPIFFPKHKAPPTVVYNAVMKHAILMLLVLMTFSCGHSVKSNDSNTLLTQLYQQHAQWQGTPYQLGGMSRQGVDCSGFVQLTFNEILGLQLPRTTRAQARLPTKVKQGHLRAGDLLFFKIPKQGKLYHVGIYLEDNKFLHASTSKGVIISSLANTYWHDNYWQSVRVLD